MKKKLQPIYDNRFFYHIEQNTFRLWIKWYMNKRMCASWYLYFEVCTRVRWLINVQSGAVDLHKIVNQLKKQQQINKNNFNKISRKQKPGFCF